MPLKDKFVVTHVSTRNERATRGSTRARRQKQEGGESLYYVSVGNTRQGRGNSLGLSSLHDRDWLWAKSGTYLSGIEPWVMKARTLFSYPVRARQRKWLRIWALDWLVLI